MVIGVVLIFMVVDDLWAEILLSVLFAAQSFFLAYVASVCLAAFAAVRVQALITVAEEKQRGMRDVS